MNVAGDQPTAVGRGCGPVAAGAPDWWLTVAADGGPAWARYLRTVYYLAAMLWAVDAGDQAVTALTEAAKTAATQPAPDAIDGPTPAPPGTSDT